MKENTQQQQNPSQSSSLRFAVNTATTHAAAAASRPPPPSSHPVSSPSSSSSSSSSSSPSSSSSSSITFDRERSSHQQQQQQHLSDSSNSSRKSHRRENDRNTSSRIPAQLPITTPATYMGYEDPSNMYTAASSSLPQAASSSSSSSSSSSRGHAGAAAVYAAAPGSAYISSGVAAAARGNMAAADMHSSRGTIIGSYRLGSTLGVGTFGKVKLGYHQGTGRKVAVKIINKAKMEAMDMHEKIRREIKILQCLSHAHVIRLYELIDTPTDIFLAMEYVQGGELFDHVVQRTRVPEYEARHFFQQIVAGVDYCHRHMVCHRDLKPENVLLDEELNVKVGDFGLSNFLRDGAFLKTSCGSPNYASPEVVSGKSYAGPEVDVWSLGVILYALLCGSLPFDDEHVPNLFKKIRHGNFLLPGHLSELSRHLIVRMLVVDPSQRITVAEIKQHPWCKHQLPRYLSSSYVISPSLTKLDSRILQQLKDLGYEVDEKQLMFEEMREGALPSRASIAYQLLADKPGKQVSFTNMLEMFCKDEPHVFSSEIRSRAAALWTSSSTSEARKAAMSRVGGARFLQRPSGRGAPAAAAPSPRTTATAGGLYPSSPAASTPRPQALATAFPLSRWKLGIEAAFDAPILLTAIVNTLKACDYEWQLLSPYKVRCRPVRRYLSSQAAHERDTLSPEAAAATRDNSNIHSSSTSGERGNNSSRSEKPSNSSSSSSVERRRNSSGRGRDTLAGNDTRRFSSSEDRRSSWGNHATTITTTGEQKRCDEDTGGNEIITTPPEDTDWPFCDLILIIQLYKVGFSRYIVDVQLFDGPTLTCLSEALWIISAVYSALTQLQQQQQQQRLLQQHAGGSGGTASENKNFLPSFLMHQGLAAFSPTTPVLLESPGSARGPISE